MLRPVVDPFDIYHEGRAYGKLVVEAWRRIVVRQGRHPKEAQWPLKKRRKSPSASSR